MKIRFFLRNQRTNKAGLAPIYCKIVLEKDSSKEFSTSVMVEKKNWKNTKVQGSDKLAEAKRNELNELEAKIMGVKQLLSFQNMPYTADVIRTTLFKSHLNLSLVNSGLNEQTFEKSIIEILIEFIEKKFIEGKIKKSSKNRYLWNIDKVKEFFTLKNMPLLAYKDFQYSHFEDLITWLRITPFSKRTRKPKKNTHLKKFSQMITAGNTYALKKGYTTTAIAEFDKFKDDAESTQYLNYQELIDIEKEDLDQNSQDFQIVRDTFVFMSYTGFQFCDVEAFDANKHLETDRDGTEWIIKPRNKTENEQIIRYFPKAKEILEKYDYKLPIFSPKHHNATIKILTKNLKINKHITNRSGRKTAGMVWLNEGASLEVVSRMLGHRDIKLRNGTTQPFYEPGLSEKRI
jgi:integrase/recombinase XerD